MFKKFFWNLFSKILTLVNLFIIRRIEKIIMRIFTRKCEIERMIISNDLIGLGLHLFHS